MREAALLAAQIEQDGAADARHRARRVLLMLLARGGDPEGIEEELERQGQFVEGSLTRRILREYRQRLAGAVLERGAPQANVIRDAVLAGVLGFIG